MPRLALALLVITAFAGPARGQGPGPDDRDEPAPNDELRWVAHARPDADQGPTRVTVAIYVLDITRLDDVQQAIAADFVLALGWNDPRLAGSEDPLRVFRLDEIWHPRPLIINKRRLWKDSEDRL
jgi:hypothetical protein